ncbi:Nitrite transporter NirC [bacterium HR29]|jgi:nitrite transporter NirC|nr:Nitrite transporter NirC [bacterium HR29]
MNESVRAAANAAAEKAALLRRNPLGYFVLSLLAGAYVGFGVVLIFSIAAPFAAAESPALKLVLGAAFGVALSLVLMAGAELFTGNNLVMTLGLAERTCGWRDLVVVWGVSYAGNLAGSLLFAWLTAQSGVLSAPPQAGLVERVVGTKMALPWDELFIRGVLANWLVCLAVWTAFRAASESAKLLMVWWCLFAFVAPGFEHSIANMTLLGVGLFQAHGDAVTWVGFVRNLVPVTVGNVVGGAAFVALAYLAAVRPLEVPILRARGSERGPQAEAAGGE